MPKNLLLALVGLVSLSSVALAEEFTGKVVGVADGDTITVLRDKTQVKIRLQAVDCPEKAQPFGTKAKQFTSTLVSGKEMIRVEVVTKDRCGRTVGRVFTMKLRFKESTMPDGSRVQRTVWEDDKCLNEELLRAGLAWHHKQYDKSEKLAKLEREARAARRGLWADLNPTPPWEWRHGKKGQGKSGDEGKGAVPGPFHGNAKSKVFHAAGCKDNDCKHCSATFPSVEEAVKQGYRPHNDCVDKVKVAPQQPASKDRACKADTDCTFEPLSGCGCPPCGDTWRRAVNKKHAALLRGMAAVGTCGRPYCAKCNRPLRWLGEKSVCIKEQCTVQ